MKIKDTPTPLDKKSLAIAAESVALMDRDFARTLATLGPPPLWEREPGFVTLVHIILEQQVSLASADAMFQRLKKNIKLLTPETVIAAGEPFLRSFGVTRQKSAYFINVAQAIQSGGLDLEALWRVSDEIAIEKLMSVKGIGQWTAKIYLLMALRRPDVWPEGDVALATAFKNLKGRLERPTQPELSEIALAWRPHRATAARMLWHYYLSGMKEEAGGQ
jgi:DNA-3-methyladenine glycosylase II